MLPIGTEPLDVDVDPGTLCFARSVVRGPEEITGFDPIVPGLVVPLFETVEEAPVKTAAAVGGLVIDVGFSPSELWPSN